MQRNTRLGSLVIFAIGFLLVNCQAYAQSKPLPNFVVILTDDQGWGTTSIDYDPDVKESKSDFFQTPNIERIAKRGVRFTQAYASHPNCSPSRAALLTGRSPAALHLTDVIGRRKGPFYEGNLLIPPQSINALPENEKTIPELLKASHPSYTTAHFGKWHLSGGGPEKHGFDASDGPTGNAVGGRNANAKQNPKQSFGITNRSVDWLKQQASAERPFYLQVSHYATHLPYQSLQVTRDKFKKMKPGDRHNNIPYAAMIADMDTAIGQLLDAIDEAGVADNTYVIFTSDNGTYPTKDPRNINGPLRGSKATVWEAGIRVPFIVYGPGIEENTTCRQQAIGYDILPTVCELAGITTWPKAVEGGSLAPALFKQGNVDRPNDALVFHWPHYQHAKKSKPDSAIRKGNYKLHYWWEDQRVELFDLSVDLAEKNDLSMKLPLIAADLKRALLSHLKVIDAQLPVVNEAYASKATLAR